MTSIFDTSLDYPKMHVWSKFGDSNSNLWRVIVRTNNVYGRTDGHTDRRTDGQTHAKKIPLRPERPRGKKWIENMAAFQIVKYRLCGMKNWYARQNRYNDIHLSLILLLNHQKQSKRGFFFKHRKNHFSKVCNKILVQLYPINETSINMLYVFQHC